MARKMVGKKIMRAVRRLAGYTIAPAVAATALILTPVAAPASVSPHGGLGLTVRATAQNLHIARMSRHALRPAGNRGIMADTACPITRGAHSGAGICGTTVLDIWWSDGRQETFVVGLDHAVWHVFQQYAGDPTWAGWYSLGGYANDGVWLWSSSPVTFYVLGSDNRYWCNQTAPGQTASGWSGFYLC